VTKMIIYDLIYSFSIYTFGYNTRYNNSDRLGEFIAYVRFQPRLFSHQKISIQTYNLCYEKPTDRS